MKNLRKRDFFSIFNELLRNAPYLRSLSLLDEKEGIIASSHKPNIGKRISLEHFLPIPFGETPLLRIGLPWEGRDFDVARESSIQNPVQTDAISFLPLLKKVSFEKRPYFVIANLNMDYLSNRYTYTLPLEQGSLTLWRIDGISLFSSDPNTRLGSSHYSQEHPQDTDDFFTHIGIHKQPTLNVFRVAKFFPLWLRYTPMSPMLLVTGIKSAKKCLGLPRYSLFSQALLRWH